MPWMINKASQARLLAAALDDQQLVPKWLRNWKQLCNSNMGQGNPDQWSGNALTIRIIIIMILIIIMTIKIRIMIIIIAVIIVHIIIIIIVVMIIIIIKITITV